MLSRFLETMMKHIGSKIGRSGRVAVRETAAGMIEPVRGSSVANGTYATEEELNRSVVKIAMEHRSALERLAHR